MAELTREEALAKAYERGLLTPEMRAAYETARSRGLLPNTPQNNAIENAGKAFGSGVVHEAIPQIMSIPGALMDLPGWDRHGMPNLEQSRDYIKKIIPEYEPKNKPEEILKQAGALAPAAALGPEMLAPRAAAGAVGAATRYGLKPLAEIGRSALAPAAAPAGVDAIYDKFPKLPYKPQAEMAAALMAPMAAGRIITPRPSKDADWTGLVNALKGDVKLLPGQKVGTERSLGMDTYLANQPGSGTSEGDIFKRQHKEFSAGAMRRAGAADGLPTGKNLQALGKQHDDEFNRLTSTYQMPVTTTATRDMSKIAADYKKGNLKPTADVDDYIQRIHDSAAANRSFPGALTGKDYQSIRSQLGEAALSADNKTAKALRDIQHTLDDTMEHTLSIAAPNDVGAFKKVRGEYGSYLAVKKAASGTGPEVAQGIITPDKLSNAIKDVSGEDTLALQKTPLSQYSRAGEAVLGLKPDTSRAERAASAVQLPLAIAGGDVAGQSALASGLGPVSAVLSGLTGAGLTSAVSQGIPSVAAKAMFARIPGTQISPLQSYLGNQVLQKAPLMLKAPSHGVIGAESLVRLKKQKEAE